MKTNTYAISYEKLLNNNPYFYDYYLDSNQRLDSFLEDSGLRLEEASFDYVPDMCSL
jgi:hypothetical protein